MSEVMDYGYQEPIAQIEESSRPDPVIMASGVIHDFLRARIDTKDLLSNLHKFIAAVEWDKNKRVWLRVPDREPLATLAFVNKLMSILWAFVNSNTLHSNLTDDQIHEITYSICEELIFIIVQSADVYRIKEENYGIIIKIVENLLLITLSRAKDDGERTHESHSFHTNERSTSRVFEQPKQGFWR